MKIIAGSHSLTRKLGELTAGTVFTHDGITSIKGASRWASSPGKYTVETTALPDGTQQSKDFDLQVTVHREAALYLNP